VTAASVEEVRGRLAWAPERCTSAARCTAADHGARRHAGAICAFLNLPPGAGTSTIESRRTSSPGA